MSLIITFMFEPAKLQMNCARASGRISRRADRAGLGANVRSADTDASVTGVSATRARADATQTGAVGTGAGHIAQRTSARLKPCAGSIPPPPPNGFKLVRDSSHRASRAPKIRPRLRHVAFRRAVRRLIGGFRHAS